MEHFQWLCDRENAPNGYLFKDIEQGGHGKKCNWEGARVSGKLKDLNLRKTPNDSYRRATGKNPIPRFFKNCRATRVTELIKKEGFSQHTVCEWIGHTEEISKNHYQMMIEEDHSRATESKTAPKTAPKSAPTSATQNTPDSIIKQAFVSLGDDQLNQLTLVLQGLADVIETQPESAHLLLTAISDEAKKPQSSSNRGRKYSISHGKYRVGKMKGVNTTPITTPSEPSKATIGFNKRKLQGLLGSIWDAVQETIEIENQS